MIISLVAQGFCSFQVGSIPGYFDFKNIRLFSISICIKSLHLQLHYVYGCDNNPVGSNLMVYLLINNTSMPIIYKYTQLL